MTPREAVENAFTKPLADLIWTANTLPAIPVTLQGFTVGPLLPAVFYMLRRGFRRGKGRFHSTFSPPHENRANIFYVSGRLSEERALFHGFETEVEKDILGDLLLCDALENKSHSEGHRAEVLRAFPVHFFASWLDLPASVSHLRFVPEMLVALLANQRQGRIVEPSSDGQFPVGQQPEKNVLFQVFGRGVRYGSNPADLRTDTASEEEGYSIEELLTIRLAQVCGEAPETMKVVKGSMAEIPNAWPIAQRASSVLREDLSVILQRYGSVVPRRAFTPMIETILSLGIWNVFLSSLGIIIEWDRSGSVTAPDEQVPVSVFVDASSGTDIRLRDLSEQSNDDLLALIDRATLALAAVRILDAKGRYDRKLRDFIPNGPDSTGWLSLLGDVRMERHERSDAILNDLSEKMEALATSLEEAGLSTEAAELLRTPGVGSNPVRALADAVCAMMGEKLLRTHYLKFLDSASMVNEPNGLGRKRRVSRTLAGRRRKMFDARSVVLSNTLLEALVHRHLAERGELFSFAEFLRLLRERYGLFVDESPPGLALAHDDLLRNRAILERRLRDLGLLVGVNDAESMKHLRGRYRIALSL